MVMWGLLSHTFQSSMYGSFAHVPFYGRAPFVVRMIILLSGLALGAVTHAYDYLEAAGVSLETQDKIFSTSFPFLLAGVLGCYGICLPWPVRAPLS